MEFGIVTDSASDLPEGIRQREDVFTVQTAIIVGEEVYNDNEISKSELLNFLTNGLHSKTSQPSPAEYINTYTEAKESYEQLLGVHVGSRLSGVFNGAHIAKSEVDPSITLYDTEHVSIGSGYFVYIATELKDLGYTREKIIEVFDHVKPRVNLRVLIDDIDYLKRGGRVNLAQYGLLKLLRLRPIVKNEGGLMVPAGFAWGRNQGIGKIVNALRGYREGEFLVFVGQINTPDDFRTLKDRAEDRLGSGTIEVPISSTLLSHVGPKALGIMVAPNVDYIVENLSDN